MNERQTLLFATACVFLATSALSQQDRAVPRSGGSRSSPGVSARPAPSARSSGVSSSSRGSSSSATSYRAPSRDLTTAERRHPRAGTGTGSRYGGRSGGRSGGHYGGHYPGNYIYPGYPGWGWGGYHPAYWGYWWPYRSYGLGYGGYAPLGAGAVYSYPETDRGSIRVLVDPTEVRVYIDGYYAGVVDDFDGLFQRLHLAPGRHEISLKLTGYQTHSVRVYVAPGTTLKLDHEMEEGTGETFEDLTRGAPMREARRSSRSFGEEPRAERGEETHAGELRLRISPVDASVYVDGEFRGTGRETATLALTPGQHRIEVVRPGYRTEDREVEIGSAAVAELTIDLERP